MLVLVATVPATLARRLGWDAGPLLVVVAFTPFVALLAVAGLVPAVLSRRVWLTVLAAVVVVVQLAWLAPLFVADDRSVTGPPRLTVATVNLGLGAGDPATVVDLVRSRRVDLLAVEELTPQARDGLRQAGLDDVLGHALVRLRPGATGTGLWSRTPITDGGAQSGWFSEIVVGTVSTGVGPITVVAAHPAAPGALHHDLWSQETSRLVDVLSALPGAVVVAGDLNTTRDQVPLRRLEDLGYRDAPDEAGAGLRMTFPVGDGPPPLVAIDHVLTRGLGAVAIAYEVVDVPGSDHRMVIVGYA